MKLAIILGTRPEIIKMSPIIKECESRKLDYFILHTNQHYSVELDKIFFSELKLPQPKYNLGIGSKPHGEQVGQMLIEIEKILMNEKPDIVLVQGDTNSVLAGALAASKLGIKIGHVEAGLRSYDRTMPEEINRVITDHISDYLFAPTEESKQNLIKEGISEKIFVVGNTIVDAVFQNIKIAEQSVNVLKALNIKPKEYVLLTMHRPSSVDTKENLVGILKGIELVYKKFKLPIIFPIHPRTEKMLNFFKLDIPSEIKIIKPQGFFEFLQLEKNAKLILTDSGGVQEEACILNVPCVTLRENTERPETLEVKSAMLAGHSPKKILESVEIMLGKHEWKNPFGDGKTSQRIIKILSS